MREQARPERSEYGVGRISLRFELQLGDWTSEASGVNPTTTRQKSEGRSFFENFEIEPAISFAFSFFPPLFTQKSRDRHWWNLTSAIKQLEGGEGRGHLITLDLSLSFKYPRRTPYYSIKQITLMHIRLKYYFLTSCLFKYLNLVIILYINFFNQTIYIFKTIYTNFSSINWYS